MSEIAVRDDDILYACTNEEEYHLILLPTEKCNFRCLYCYEDHSIGKMRPEVVNAVKFLVSRKIPTISHLSIDWFGGEPLLGASIIKEVNAFAQECVSQSEKTVKFRSAITTNAFLLDTSLFKDLLSVGVGEFQITLDGPKEIHDTTRVQVDGTGSFDRIWKNLINMSGTPGAFDVLLRVHVTQTNIDQIPELINQIRGQFGHDKRFKIFLKAIQDLGGYGSEFAASVGLPENDEKLEKVERDLKGPNEFWHPNSICHASKLNSFLIRADGRIAKCTTALYDDVNLIGHLRPNGDMELDLDKVLMWSRGVFEMDRNILYCPYGGIHKDTCNTGCGSAA